MTANQVYYRWTPPAIKPPSSLSQKDVRPAFCSPAAPYQSLSHTSLRVSRPEPESSEVTVVVMDGSSGRTKSLVMQRSDTAGELCRRLREEQGWGSGGAGAGGAELALALRGKSVDLKKSLRDLGVKNCATFITYQRCHGG